MPDPPLLGGFAEASLNKITADDSAQTLAEHAAQALITAEQLELRRATLHAELADLERVREAAVQALDSLVGPPLAEIRRLCRNPPELVRHTLLALWLVLHCEAFAGKVVRASDLKWPHVQRMLTEDGFIAKVKGVTVNKLDSVPTVCEFLQSNFFTSLPQTAPTATGSQTARERVARASLRSATQSSFFTSLPQTVHATIGSQTARERFAQASSRSATAWAAAPGSARGTGSQFAQLDARSVGRASQPCGTLVKWMLAIFGAQQRRSKLSKELGELDAQHERCLQERSESLAMQARAAAESESGTAATTGSSRQQLVAAKRPPPPAPQLPMGDGRPLVPANWRFRPRAPPSFLPLFPPGEALLPTGEAPRLSAATPKASDESAPRIPAEKMKQVAVSTAAKEVPVRALVARYVQGSLPTELQSRLPRIAGMTSARRTSQGAD